MSPDLHDKTWMACGISMLWDAEALNEICSPEAVRSSQEAVEWLEKKVYQVVRDYQDNVADGGGEAALIFWFADAKRIWHRAADNTNHWYCSGEHRQHSIPIGRCIWNGAESSVRRIVTVDSDKKQRNIGLFLRRIS